MALHGVCQPSQFLPSLGQFPPGAEQSTWPPLGTLLAGTEWGGLGKGWMEQNSGVTASAWLWGSGGMRQAVMGPSCAIPGVCAAQESWGYGLQGQAGVGTWKR